MVKIALLGVDGASWNNLKWLIDEGFMPNLEKMIRNGVFGDLKSTIPPITGAAWLAIATGLNPGKTGVIDFFKHIGNFVFEPVSSIDYRDKSIWDYLSYLNYTVNILDYPMLYPAYPVNGTMISTWGGKITTYPTHLTNEIKEIMSDYDIFVDYHLEKYNDIELFLNDLKTAVEKKLRMSRRLMKNKANLFIDILSFTDWIQHRMWHYIDENHPLYPGYDRANRYKRSFAEFWRLLDEYIGEVIEIYDYTFVVSDHGFGPQWGVFDLTKWLETHGFSKINHNITTMLKERIFKLLSNTGLYKLIPYEIRQKARKRRLSTFNFAFYYDLNETKVIAPNFTIPFGAIIINPKFSEQAENILENIEKEFEKLRNELGKEIEVTTWRVRDLYKGKKLSLLPDLIFTINDWSCVITKNPESRYIYLEKSYSPRHTGSHRLYGIFVGYGKDLKKDAKVSRASVFDIAPTLLHIFNMPIPQNMDGRILTEIFDDNSEISKRKPMYVNETFYLKYKIKKRIKEPNVGS